MALSDRRVLKIRRSAFSGTPGIVKSIIMVVYHSLDICLSVCLFICLFGLLVGRFFGVFFWGGVVDGLDG